MTPEADTLASTEIDDVYDRSSIKGDFMVVIEGQTSEDWERRAPDNQFCEYLDGLIYFHPPMVISFQEFEEERGIYDRSSLKGDFMVILEDQTSEDFEKYAPENAFCDYLEGRVYMPSPVTARHQKQVGFFYKILGFLGERLGRWEPLMGPAALRLDEEHKPEPDVFIIPIDGPAEPTTAYFVIEVLSPSTRSHDQGRKLQSYKDAGIPEIWIVDDRDHKLIAERRRGEEYVREEYTSGIVACEALPGFWVDLDWLWSDPLPGASACLARILADRPV